MRKETMKISLLYIKPSMPGSVLTRSLCILPLMLSLSLMFSLWGCSQDELMTPDDPATGGSGHELAEGERCNVTLSVTGMPSIEQATTRAIPEGKNTVLMDFTNHELKSREGKEAGWISTEVRTEFGEEERAATRAIPAEKLFQNYSKFRMLVFKGPYGGTVNMNTPVANMVCQVKEGKAEFLSPSTSLGLLKGTYTFICFPADEKYNKWQVGESNKSKVTVSNDEDFVYCKVADVDMNTSTKKLKLDFTRKCYKLTVKLLVAEELGYIVGVDTVPITVGNSSGTSPIVSSATCDLSTGDMSGYKNALIESRIPVLDKGKIPQSFGSVDNMLIAPAIGTNNSKLSIGYPQITVLKPKGTDDSANDSIFTINAGFVTTKDEFTFAANQSYTITLSIGKQVKGITVGGVVWATGNLVYNSTSNKYEKAPTPNKAKNAKEVRGDWFRWCYLLPQSSSNTATTYIQTKWDVTTPNWSGITSKTLGNYSYYKSYYINTEPSGTPNANSTGDPCKGLGGKWRMPTYNEIYLLCYVATSAIPSATFNTARNRLENFGEYTATWDGSNASEKEEASIYRGIYITGGSQPNENPLKISSTGEYNAGKHLFLPAAGRSNGANINFAGAFGYYWSSTPLSGRTNYSWVAYFRSGYLGPSSNGRGDGFPVRCVLGD